MSKTSRQSGPKKFASKSYQNIQTIPPPRIIVIGEGKMEVQALTDFVRNITSWRSLAVQPINSTYRIEAGGFVTPQFVCRKLMRLINFIANKQEAEAVCGLIDHEDRTEDWRDFLTSCRNFLNASCTSPLPNAICVASRSTEAWVIADIEKAAEIITPKGDRPRQTKYRNVENISHPVELEVKKYWPDYKKTRHGALFLKNIRPEIVIQHSESFADFVNAIESLSIRAIPRR